MNRYYLSLGKIDKRNITRRNNMSSFAPRSNNNNRNKNNNQKLYKTNFFQNKNKLFSLLDINDKITNSRGTILPIQFKRLSDDENKRLFGFSYRTDKRYDFSKIQQILGKKVIKTQKSKIVDDKFKENKKGDDKIKTYTLKRSNSDIEDKLNNKKNKFFAKNFKIKFVDKNFDKEMKNNNIKYSKNDNDDLYKKSKLLKNTKKENNQNEFIKIKNNIYENQKNFEDEIKIRISRDRLLPKGYASYELLVKHPRIFSNQLKRNSYINKNYSITLKQIKDKSNKSDIFFLKNPSEKEVSFKYKIQLNNFQNSDVFNIKNDEQNLLKSSETYIFKNREGEKYDITRESNSKWKPGTNFLTFINYSSQEYNILNPSKRGISSTKEKIINDCEKKQNINSNMKNSLSYMNPIYRQKGLAEFIDITRNGASNPGKDFRRTFYNNPKCFFKQDEACNTFYNSYHRYQNICNKPFAKDFYSK